MADASVHEKTMEMLRQLSSEQLLDLLRQDAMGDGLSEDGVYVAQVMEVLEEKEKAKEENHLSDVSQAFRDFQAKYNIPEGDGLSLFDTAEEDVSREGKASPRPRKKSYSLGRRIAIAAVIAAILAVMVPAALGYNIFEAIGRWTSERFHLEQENIVESSTQTGPAISPIRTEFESLQDALDNCGISEIQAPQWLPEGYALTESSVYSSGDSFSISASYTYGEDFLLVLGSRGMFAFGTYQKDSEPVEEFYTNEVRHYIFSNNANYVVVWYYEDTEFMVSGPVSLETIKKIVVSMYSE